MFTNSGEKLLHINALVFGTTCLSDSTWTKLLKVSSELNSNKDLDLHTDKYIYSRKREML
jgi:hypothetical protein